MSDQATLLRQIIGKRQSPDPQPVEPPAGSARTIALTSGKGGVGKSVLALNLGLALIQHEARVALLDANLGLGNLDLLCTLNGYWNLSHVITGARSLRDVVLDGPAGLQLVPGASGLIDAADCPAPAQQGLLNQMVELERNYDFLIVDTGAGIHRPVRMFVDAADLVLIVTTPEPTSIADAYATVKAFGTRTASELRLLVNQADSAQQARHVFERLQQTSRIFLRREIEYAGFVPQDPCVRRSVVERQPCLLKFPDAPASATMRQLAERLRRWQSGTSERAPFFTRLWTQITSKAA